MALIHSLQKIATLQVVFITNKIHDIKFFFPSSVSFFRETATDQKIFVSRSHIHSAELQIISLSPAPHFSLGSAGCSWIYTQRSLTIQKIEISKKEEENYGKKCRQTPQLPSLFRSKTYMFGRRRLLVTWLITETKLVKRNWKRPQYICYSVHATK